MNQNETAEMIAEKPEMIQIEPATMSVYTIDFGYKELLNECSIQNTLITDCINGKYDQLYGKSYQNQVIRSFNQTLVTFDGYDSIKRTTDCLMPCQKFVYRKID